MGPDLAPLRIGDWLVDLARGELVRGERRVPLESRRLAVLLALAERPGEVLDLDALTHAGWGDTPVSADSVYQAIAQLRRALGDSAAKPRYIATVARRGYRLVATVDRDADGPARASDAGAATPVEPTATALVAAAAHAAPRRGFDDRRR